MKGIRVDVLKGKIEEIDDGQPFPEFPPPSPPPKLIDIVKLTEEFERLKQILKQKGIIDKWVDIS